MIRPIETVETQFSFLISLNHLVVTAIPSEVIEYDISRLYLKDVKQTKKYPLYGYKLPKNYDTDVSEFGNSVFITTVSEGGDYQVFVYRTGLPAVGALYDIIDLFTYQPILLDASGTLINYVSVISGN